LSNSEPLSWLLEDDPENPGVKYFALHDLLGAEEGSIGLRRARKDIMEYGPVPRILAARQVDHPACAPGTETNRVSSRRGMMSITTGGDHE
jgi:hypothetical protein